MPLVLRLDSWQAIILAAGRGSRMRSSVPKVLQPICGREMVGLVGDALCAVGFDAPVVVVPPNSPDVSPRRGTPRRSGGAGGAVGHRSRPFSGPDASGRPSRQCPGNQWRLALGDPGHPVRPDAPPRVDRGLPHHSNVQRASFRRHGAGYKGCGWMRLRHSGRG